MTSVPGVLDELSMFARYAAGLRTFLRQPLSSEQCRPLIERQLERREETFLKILQAGIYGNRSSPYRRLLEHAGAQFGDVARMVRSDGVEGSLDKLYDAGVRISIDEFKGRTPIERPGLSIAVRPAEFDNPLLARHYETQSGGSRGVVNRVAIDLDLVTHEAAYYHEFAGMFGLRGRPVGVWRDVPPVSAGLRAILRYVKLGLPVEKWFSQNHPRSPGWKAYLFTRFTVHGSRWWGGAIPAPQHVPMGEARQVARWLAEVRKRGMPAMLDTHAGSGVRVCHAAVEERLDISGTFFRLGSEPYTPAKERVIRGAGCDAACNYHSAETGVLGMTCGARVEPDEVHLMSDAFGVIQRVKPVGSGVEVGALAFTSLSPACSKLLLNVEMGDYAVLDERRCGCPWEQLGFTRHLRGIRSYEKLTAAGMTFLGTELVRLVEEVLPPRFGGGPTDYQFVEEEQPDGLTRVSLVVSARAGPISDQEVVAAVLRFLETYPGGKLMAGIWRDTGTLRVERREPYLTSASKILPLHIRGA
jgi:hypothetical protein